MSIRNVSTRLRLLLILTFVLLVTVGCGRRLGVGWPVVSVANAEQDMMVAYKNEVVLISRNNGFLVTENLEDTTTNPDTGNAWRLSTSDGSGEFYTRPLPLGEANDEQLMLVADYNGEQLFYVNFDRSCFSNQVGSCVMDEPPAITFEEGSDGKVVGNMGQDSQRVYVPLSQQDVVAFNKGRFAEVEGDESEAERSDRFDRTMTQAWRFDTDRGVWSAPVSINGDVYISSMDHNLYRVAADSGTEQARVDLGGAILDTAMFYDGTEATDYPDDVAPPQNPEYDLESGRFYVSTFSSRIYEVPLGFSDELTREDLTYYETRDWVWGAPKIVDGVLYAADLGGNVYALDVENGLQEIWSTQTEAGGIRGTPLVTEDFVIVGTRDGVGLWLRREDGTEFTRQDIGDEILSDPVLLPGDEEAEREALVIISTVNESRMVQAFSIDGAPRWTYPSS